MAADGPMTQETEKHEDRCRKKEEKKEKKKEKHEDSYKNQSAAIRNL